MVQVALLKTVGCDWLWACSGHLCLCSWSMAPPEQNSMLTMAMLVAVTETQWLRLYLWFWMKHINAAQTI